MLNIFAKFGGTVLKATLVTNILHLIILSILPNILGNLTYKIDIIIMFLCRYSSLLIY